jgi:hypothetical protein
MKMLLFAAAILTTPLAFAADRYLHISVADDGDTVRISVPLAFVEKLLPSVHVDRIRSGRISLRYGREGVRVRELLEAVRSSADGEFVTVENRHEQLRVAKSGGYLLIKARDGRRGRGAENVEIKMPMTVLEAMVKPGSDDLDLLAAIRALSAHGDITLVTVEGDREKVKIWVDGKSRQ